MKKKHLAIVIVQSVAIVFLIVFARVQQMKAQAAEREALAQFELAAQSRAEAEKQREQAERSIMMADKNAEEAKRQAELARKLQEKCK